MIIKKMSSSNINSHLVPVLFSILLLGAITSVPWSGSKKYLYILSCFVPLIFFIIWCSIPVKNKKHKLCFGKKISKIYNNPSLITQSTLPITILLSGALYVFIMRGNM